MSSLAPTNAAMLQRTQSFAPARNQEAPRAQITRTQSLVLGKGIGMSLDSLYNQAVHYHKVEKNFELAEAAFLAVLKRNHDHVPSLLGLGSMLMEKGNEVEGKEYLNKATGLIMCPHTLPGEDIARKQAKIRSASNRNLLVDGGMSIMEEAKELSHLPHMGSMRDMGSTKNLMKGEDADSSMDEPPKMMRMGSMKQVLSMNEANDR